MKIESTLSKHFELHRVPTVSVGLSIITLLLWVTILGGWLPMPGSAMGSPMSDPGVAEAMATSNGLEGVASYLLVWGVMMSAMMYPAMLPFVRRYAGALRGSSVTRAAAIGVFLGAYSLVWTVTGIVPLMVDAVVDISGLARDHGTFIVGGMLLVVAAYQLSSYKRDSLRKCCSTVEPGRPSVRVAVRSGIEHGLSCVRCTWVLFALIVVVGSMNAFWMLLLTMVVTAERLVGWGDELAATIGVVSGVGGIAVLLLDVPVF